MRVERIGDATLYLGDCREIIPTLPDIDVVVTDPPFGMSFRSNFRSESYDKIANDDTTDLLLIACKIPVRHSRYVFCRWDNLYDAPKPKSMVTWVKNNWSMGDLEHEHARQTEVLLFYPGHSHNFPRSRPTDVINAPRTGNCNHPTEKPVQLMRAILEWTSGGVLDPFMGSGSTGVAALSIGRKFTGIEIDPKYFEIACRRMEETSRQGDLIRDVIQKKTPDANPGLVFS
jgi:site-specific DNA-methyltransferase (adenine-specific)